MLSSNRWAFKEWAAVCEALVSGRQTIILRKGGIHEGRDGFRIDHSEFWLFATRFHQTADELAPDAGALLTRSSAAAPAAGNVLLPGYVSVESVARVMDERILPRLRGLHILSDHTVTDRFHYREPGLFVLTVRVFRDSALHTITDLPRFGGCRSWIDLPEQLPTKGLVPVLADPEFASSRSAVDAALAQT